ncbi:MAG: hypothetical protein JRG92_09505 [Deltaproteobacteria bacterium]|jgi:hypothetical protein|nr:hypothetical protein [Deltaproteobacteria bacterium]MBW2383861.1 hypothetical protein [Deltaproteobacteria bacterium]MBW2695068.1 hypothetical protein [Deltaproteobacteria bacterium]
MILLDNHQILAAVQRSLQTHILPMLEDDFAKVQVASAMKALQEVCDRLADGDPCDRMNADLMAGARSIVVEHERGSPELCRRLEQLLSSMPENEDARDLNRALGEGLWQLVAAAHDDPAAKGLLKLLYDQALAVYSADGQYIAIEAIASLT